MREKLFLYSLLSSFAFFSFVALLMLIPFLKPVLWAVIFSLALYPVHIKLSKLLKSNTLSALLIVLFVLLMVVVPFGFVLALAIKQSIELINLVLAYTQNHNLQELLNSISLPKYIQRFIDERTLESLQRYVSSEEFKNIVLSGVRDITQRFLSFLTSFVPAVGVFVFKTFVFLLTLFFILRDGPKFVGFIKRFFPMHTEDLEQVLLTVYKTVLATVYGSVGVAFLQAILGFIGYKVVGIDYSILLAIATFFSSFLPPFGAGFVWFPVMVYAFVEKGMWQGVFMLLYGSLIISTADNILRPLIMKMGVNIPYIVLFFSITGGLLTFGFIGVFIGPIIFTTLFTLALIYEKKVLKA